eukprot:Skav211677  [mRNA]  locus=scaffold216:230798:233939:+ [translate_table: standard]
MLPSLATYFETRDIVSCIGIHGGPASAPRGRDDLTTNGEMSDVSTIGLPASVKKKMNEAEAAVEAEGKEVPPPPPWTCEASTLEGQLVKEKGLLYFRKPDVNHEEGEHRRGNRFKLSEGTAVTFRLYVDNLGAGALDVSMA